MICLNGILLSCSHQDNSDFQLYDYLNESQATGGENEQTPPPPPPPNPNGGN